MDLFKCIIANSRTIGIFSIGFPQTPADLQNPEFLKAYKCWVYACVRVIANAVGKMKVDLLPGAYEIYCPVDNHAEVGMEL
jgi:hypothetical protein